MCINTDNLTKAGKILLPILIFIWLLPFLIVLVLGISFWIIEYPFKQQLFECPLPAETILLDKMTDGGNIDGGSSDRQDFIAIILIKSELSQEELQDYYAEQLEDALGPKRLNPFYNPPSGVLLDVSPALSPDYRPEYSIVDFHFQSMEREEDTTNLYYVSIFS
ncbi:MAG: hypothetical protein Q4B50_07480 [Bacillota bacterium]|nr:hypothetical protein [Bacillota bacterium]